VTEGWWKIDAGTCHTYDNRFQARYMFWFATSDQFNNPPDFPNNTPQIMSEPCYCVPDFVAHGGSGAFTYEDENVKDDPTGQNDHCISLTNSDHRWVKFRVVDTWVDPTVNFTGQ